LKLIFGRDHPEISQKGFTLNQDLCRHWLRIATAHVKDAQEANLDLLAANDADDEKALGPALEREFQASMQGIVAAAIALDALYASIEECIEIPDEQKEA
jgi:hypothetical protein